MSIAQIVKRIIEDVFGIILVDGIVGEMHTEVIHVVFWGVFIGFRSESNKSLVVDVDSKGIASGY